MIMTGVPCAIYSKKEDEKGEGKKQKPVEPKLKEPKAGT